tara:strand:- start:2636 stop:3928 length:1293 start_codon:yes stop_codon:yes gene_type:complete
MLTNKFYKYPVMILMLAVISFACSDTNNSDSATVNGSVEQSQAKAKAFPEGTVVTMGTVTSNGSIEVLDGVETTTNASGEFSLTFDAKAAQNFVVIAEHEGEKTMGFLSSNVENGSNIILKPIDEESTAETKIFAKIVSNGDSDLTLKSDIEAVITSNNAAEVKNNANLIAQFAVAIANSAQARADFFAEEVEGNAQEKLETSIKILVDAQARLESDLNEASNTEEEEAAIDLFLETSANAFASAEVEANKASAALSLWARLMVNNISSTSENVKNEVRSQVSVMAAIALKAAVEAEAEASEMSEDTKSDIRDAGVQLMADVKAALGAKSEIEAAFESFQARVEESMGNDSSINAEFILNVNVTINSTTGAKTIYDNSIVSAVSANVALNVFSSFESGLSSASDAAESGQMTEASIESATRILLLLNMNS